jgi:hypothetical protein
VLPRGYLVLVSAWVECDFSEGAVLIFLFVTIDKRVNEEEDIVGLCAGDQCGAVDHICDTILDPSKKERIEEKERAQRVEDSRALWLGTRKLFFKQ